MASTPNSISSLSTIQSIKAAILPANSTSTAAAVAAAVTSSTTTTRATVLSAALTNLDSNKPTASEHIEITNVHGINDCLQRLGEGDLSDVVTEIMVVAIIIGMVCICAIGYQFIRQLPFVLRHTPSEYRARTLLLCSVYTIVGLIAFTSLIAYQAYVFCDAVCHFTFLLLAYQYFVLIIDYVDGESNFIIKTSGLMVFDVRTPPLCCCMQCLLPTAITKKKFQALRLMVLQMPIIQGSLLVLLNVFNAIDRQLYDQNRPILMLFIVPSIMTGVWALQITSRMIAKHLPDHKIMHKYASIQLVLILYKLQPILLQALASAIASVTDYHIASKCVENAIIQLIILMETVFLSYFANQSYSVPTKVF